MSGNTGSIRTSSYLLSSEFEDGQAAGSITPQDMRDLIVSVGTNAWRPANYGTSDDTPAIQACISAIMSSSFGRGTVDLGPHSYNCNSQLLWESCECVSFTGDGAILNFYGMPAAAVVGNVTPDPNCATTADWTVSSGTVAFGHPGAYVASGSVLFGCAITLAANTRYRVTMNVTTDSSGNMQWGIGSGINSGVFYQTNVPSGSNDATWYWEFQNWNAGTFYFFVTSASGSFTINSVNIDPWQEANACIVASDNASTNTYGSYGTRNMMGVEIQGSGGGGCQTAIYCNTTTNGNSTRLCLENTSIVGFQTGIAFGNRAYADHSRRVQIASCATCLLNLGGADQGEIFGFSDSQFFNSTNGLDGGYNTGTFVFNACHFDFVTQWMKNIAGPVNCFGCWLEDDPITFTPNLYKFTVYLDGCIQFRGGLVQIDTSGAANTYVALLNDAASRMIFDGTFVYNLVGASDTLAAGNGTVQMLGRSIDAGYGFPAMMIRNTVSDLFGGQGGFENNIIPFMTGVTSGATTGSTTAGSVSLATSTTVARTGSNSLKWTRPVSTDSHISLWVPVQPNHRCAFECYYNNPTNVGSGTSSVSFNVYWAQFGGFDSSGRPKLTVYSAIYSSTLSVAQNGSGGWQKLQVSTWGAGFTDSGFAPPWATHIYIDFYLSPSDAVLTNLYFDDFFGNVL